MLRLNKNSITGIFSEAKSLLSRKIQCCSLPARTSTYHQPILPWPQTLDQEERFEPCLLSPCQFTSQQSPVFSQKLTSWYWLLCRSSREPLLGNCVTTLIMRFSSSRRFYFPCTHYLPLPHNLTPNLGLWCTFLSTAYCPPVEKRLIWLETDMSEKWNTGGYIHRNMHKVWTNFARRCHGRKISQKKKALNSVLKHTYSK